MALKWMSTGTPSNAFGGAIQLKMEYLKKLEQKIEVQCYSPSTLKTYKHHIKGFLRYYHHDLRQENIERHLYYLKTARNYSPESLNIVRSALIYFFEKILKKPLTIEITKSKRKKSLPRPVSREVILRLLKHTYNLKHRVLLEMAYSSGLRPFEVLRLKWHHLDIINKTVRVDAGKGRKDRLSILSDEVSKHLLDLKEEKPSYTEYVFFSSVKKGTHLSKKSYQKILEKASLRANIGFIVTPYQLRHSFGTHLFENGTDTRYIQELMGHSSPKTTEGYVRVARKNLITIKSPLDITIQEDVKSNKQEGEKVVSSN